MLHDETQLSLLSNFIAQITWCFALLSVPCLILILTPPIVYCINDSSCLADVTRWSTLIALFLNTCVNAPNPLSHNSHLVTHTSAKSDESIDYISCLSARLLQHLAYRRITSRIS